MKLKSLLAIVSCSAIALSISVPTIAETVKKSQIKLEPTGIGNKQSLGEMFFNHSTKPIDFGNNNSTQQSSPAQIYEQKTEERLQQYYKEKEERRQEQIAAQQARERARLEAEAAARQRRIIEEQAREKERIIREQEYHARRENTEKRLASRNDSGLVGYWKSSVAMNGEASDNYMDLSNYGNFRRIEKNSLGRTRKVNLKWEFSNGYLWTLSDKSDVYKNQIIPIRQISIEWISKDEFIATTVKSSNSKLIGVRQKFIRTERPKIVTNPTRTGKSFNDSVNDYNHTVRFGNALPSLLNGIK